MQHWQFLVIAGVVFLIIEMLTPVLFFLNLALACFITAVLAFFVFDWNVLIPAFVVFSAIFLLFLRPLLIKTRTNGQKTGMDEKYVGKIAKVTETVTKTSGLVSIYDERWTARTETDEEIPVGAEVKIIRYEDLILYVKKEG